MNLPHAAHTEHTPSPVELRVRGLSLAYGSQQVLRDLDWTPPAGQVVGLLGRNGAGKTTLLESLLGLREPAPRRSAGASTTGWSSRTRARSRCSGNRWQR